MSRSLPSQRDVVIGYAPDDGSIDIFEEFEEADGCLLVLGEVEDVWTTFYRLDGEKLAPRLGQYDWVEQLIPTGFPRSWRLGPTADCLRPKARFRG